MLLLFLSLTYACAVRKLCIHSKNRFGADIDTSSSEIIVVPSDQRVALILKQKSDFALVLVSFAVPSFLSLNSCTSVSFFAAAWSSINRDMRKCRCHSPLLDPGRWLSIATLNVRMRRTSKRTKNQLSVTATRRHSSIRSKLQSCHPSSG